MAQTQTFAVRTRCFTTLCTLGRIVVLVLGFYFLVIPFSASAENLTVQTAPARTSYYGLSQSQIEDRFGKADSERKKPNGSVEWMYGRSSMFFLDGKVTAWSDVGELSQRERIHSIKTEKPINDDSLSGVWQNPWTPPARDKSADDTLDIVVDE